MDNQAKHKLLTMMGYKGPASVREMDAFIQSSPAVSAKMGQFMGAAKKFSKGGMTKGYATGGYVMGANNTIMKSDGTPHKTYSTLSEAYNALQTLNNPTTAQPTTSAPAQSGFNQVPQAQPNTSGGSTPAPTTTGYQATPQPTQPPATTPVTGYDRYRGDLNNLYLKYLGRGVQDAGLNFYGQHLQSGNIDLAGVEADIRQSPEAKKFAETNISNLYQNVLGRPADQAGMDYYTNQYLSGNLTLHQIRQQLNNALTGQTAAAPGTQTSGPPVTQGQTPATGGATFQPQNQDQAAQFDQLRNSYRQIFGRNPDQAGLDFWMGKIADGSMNIEDVLNQLIQSEEAQLINNQQYNEAQALRESQQRFLSSSYQAPQDLVTGQQVASMQVQEGELVNPATGQVSGDVGYTASTIGQDQVAQAQAPGDIGTATYEATQISQELQNTLGDLEAQTATPSDKATVRGQLEILMDDFQDGNPPWAQGAMREASAIMQKRGLGASSMAGQAITQAALEAATAIAQSDANTFATFELRNLDNRQQTAIFKAQQRIAGLFTDQAASNAAKQFNASSENQTRQFMASLEENVSRFNAAQVNAVNEINVNAENAAKQFNSTMADLRDRFNAQNSLVIAQANAQWRQNINTINTAAQNDANREYAKTVNAVTTAALDQLWQRERDLMTYAFSASESGLERELRLMMADKQEDLVKWQQDREEDAAKGYVFTRLASEVLFGGGGLFG